MRDPIFKLGLPISGTTEQASSQKRQGGEMAPYLWCIAEECKHEAGEVVRVHVWEAQVVGHRIQQVVAPLVIQLQSQQAEYVHRWHSQHRRHRGLAAR